MFLFRAVAQAMIPACVFTCSAQAKLISVSSLGSLRVASPLWHSATPMDRGSLDVVRMQVDVRWTLEWNECTLPALLMCSYPCLDRTSRKWSTEFEWPEGFSMLFRAGEGCRSYTRYGKDHLRCFV